jgi:hypothetical protein
MFVNEAGRLVPKWFMKSKTRKLHMKREQPFETKSATATNFKSLQLVTPVQMHTTNKSSEIRNRVMINFIFLWRINKHG